MDRTAHVKLAALAAPEIGRAIWQYFGPGSDDVKLLVLRESLAKAPGQAEAAYLIGRKLTTHGDQPLLAVKYLSQALSSGALPPSIAKEALRLKLESRFLSGDCAGCAKRRRRFPTTARCSSGAPMSGSRGARSRKRCSRGRWCPLMP